MDIAAIIKYFELNEHPFMTSPDPRFLYFSSQVKEALAKCEFMARDRIGPIYMYGPIGSGKTSLVRRLQEKFSQDERYNVKLLIPPNLKSSNAFLRLILSLESVYQEAVALLRGLAATFAHPPAPPARRQPPRSPDEVVNDITTLADAVKRPEDTFLGEGRIDDTAPGGSR
jgi:type II secretory pathway predicted ATPase ExeA